MNKIFFFGTSGGCLDSFYLNQEINGESNNQYFLSDIDQVGKQIQGKEVIGGFDYINDVNVENSEFVYQVGSVKNHISRDIWYKNAIVRGLIPRTLISKNAYVHKSASIGKGSIVYPGVKIMRDVCIGENCIVLPNSVINHDSKIENFCIINSSCVINGNVTIGHNSYIGSSTCIREDIMIEPKVTIGMSSVVLKSIRKEGVYFGNPLKVLD